MHRVLAIDIEHELTRHVAAGASKISLALSLAWNNHIQQSRPGDLHPIIVDVGARNGFSRLQRVIKRQR